MLRIVFAVIVAAALIGCSRQEPKPTLRPPSTFSSFDKELPGEQPQPAHSIHFENADLNAVLNAYATNSHRSIIRGANLPDIKITFSNELPMTRVKILQALDTVLAAQGITAIALGTDYVKVVNSKEAPTEAPPIFTGSPDDLPDSSSFVIYAMELHSKSGMNITQAITPFSRSPNSIIFCPGNPPSAFRKQVSVVEDVSKVLGPKAHDILILRDYSTNVRKMLQVVAKLQGDNQ